LALSIGHVLLRDKLAPASLARSVNDLPAYQELVSGFTPEKVSPACGISAEAIVATAHAVAESPSVIISGTDAAGGTFDRMTETAIAALNILAGNINRPGGIQDSEPTPGQNHTALPATALADQPDGSIRVLIIDGAQSGCTFPPSLLNRKLAPDATVVQLSPYLSDHSALADYFVPSPAAYEAVEEVTAPAGTLSPMFALSMPLLQAPGTSVDPASFIAKLSEALAIPAAETTTEACLRQRARQILLAKKGSVRDATGGSPTPVKDIAGEEDFWRIVSEGGCWYGETVVKSSIVPASLMGPIPATEFLKAATTTAQATGSLKLIPFGWRGTTGSAHVAPVMSKLFQESHLRDLGGRLHVNPATLALAGLADGSHVQVRTSAGTFTGWAVADQAVIPGVVHASVGPSPNNSTPKDKPGQASILEICAVQADGSWRITEATIAKA
jgi:anaerobic selenocysteine-containing dehydrogenase